MFCQSKLIFFFEKMNSCREFYKIKKALISLLRKIVIYSYKIKKALISLLFYVVMKIVIYSYKIKIDIFCHS